MKLFSVSAKNFGSYKEIHLDLANKGLALIYGPTGSGKSTIFDVACWALFGVTAKGGAVDAIRSWQADDEVTEATAVLQINQCVIKVYRKRGKANQNDLYWKEDLQEEEKRGKDLAETQRNLEKRLGVSADLYLTSAYFSEFSFAANFFVTSARERRQVFDKISDLDFPAKLAENASYAKKLIYKTIIEHDLNLSKLQGKLEQLLYHKQNQEKLSNDWEASQLKLIAELQKKADAEDATKKKELKRLEEAIKEYKENLIISTSIVRNEISETQEKLTLVRKRQSSCSKCGQRLPGTDEEPLLIKLDDLDSRYHDLMHAPNPFETKYKQCLEKVNPYTDKVYTESLRENPYKCMSIDTSSTEKDILELSNTLSALNHRHSCLDTLYDLSYKLRGSLLEQSVSQVQDSTNRYLDTYFDSEIKVTLLLEDADKLGIIIHKSGYECSYSQLSKGQRGLLKLCFGVSIMEAASSKSGVNFENLYFDEALDGFDNSLKIKAFDLFSELSLAHGSVFVIDHSPDLQSMFASRYKVSLLGDLSVIEDDSE